MRIETVKRCAAAGLMVSGLALGYSYIAHPHHMTTETIASAFWVVIHALFALSLMAGAFSSRRPNLADLARPPVGPNAVAPDPETDTDPDRMAIEDAWADLEAKGPSPQPDAPQEVPADDALPADDYDQEAEAIRAEIRKMRQMVEQMQQAERGAAMDKDPSDEPRD